MNIINTDPESHRAVPKMISKTKANSLCVCNVATMILPTLLAYLIVPCVQRYFRNEAISFFNNNHLVSLNYHCSDSFENTFFANRSLSVINQPFYNIPSVLSNFCKQNVSALCHSSLFCREVS